MANKRITDVDFVDSLDSNESFFINKNNTLKQVSKSNVVFGITNGGTGASNAEDARANLGAAAINHTHTIDSLNITPESIGAAPEDHTHTSESLNITPASINAAEEGHVHTYTQIGLTNEQVRKITITDTSVTPSGGNNGDLWFRYKTS